MIILTPTSICSAFASPGPTANPAMVYGTLRATFFLISGKLNFAKLNPHAV